MNEQTEEWRRIIDRYQEESGYEVSNLGRVRSQHPGREGRILKGGEGADSTAYKRRSVWLTDVYHPQSRLNYVENLVAGAFLDRPKPGQRLTWLNGCKWDNRVANLAWTDTTHTQFNPAGPHEETLAELEARVNAAWTAVRKATEVAMEASKALGLTLGQEEAQKGTREP